jgi:hypothetical protein
MAQPEASEGQTAAPVLISACIVIESIAATRLRVRDVMIRIIAWLRFVKFAYWVLLVGFPVARVAISSILSLRSISW